MGTVKMTPEVQEALLGLSPFSADSTIEFTPAYYLNVVGKGKGKKPVIPVEFQPVFDIRPLTKEEGKKAKIVLLRIYENMDAKKAGESRPHEDEHFDEVDDLSRLVVMGWRRLYDAGNMQVVAYKKSTDTGADEIVYEKVVTRTKSAIFLFACKITGLLDLERLGLTS